MSLQALSDFFTNNFESAVGAADKVLPGGREVALAALGVVALGTTVLAYKYGGPVVNAATSKCKRSGAAPNPVKESSGPDVGPGTPERTGSDVAGAAIATDLDGPAGAARRRHRPGNNETTPVSGE